VQTRWQFEHANKNMNRDKLLKKLWRCSRDSARTPVQWSAEKNAGFTDGDTTWFHVNPNYPQINVADQEQDPDSILHFYRKAIRLRKELPVVRHGSYKEHNPLSGKHYIYSREMEGQRLLVICSFSSKQTTFRAPKGFDLTNAKLILQNYSDPQEGILKPYETRVYLWD
jgi:glycosidase